MIRASVENAFANRWEASLAVAAQRAFAATLLELPVDEGGLNGEEPLLEDVLHAARLLEPAGPSRLGAPSA